MVTQNCQGARHTHKCNPVLYSNIVHSVAHSSVLAFVTVRKHMTQATYEKKRGLFLLTVLEVQAQDQVASGESGMSWQKVLLDRGI